MDITPRRRISRHLRGSALALAAAAALLLALAAAATARGSHARRGCTQTAASRHRRHATVKHSCARPHTRPAARRHAAHGHHGGAATPALTAARCEDGSLPARAAEGSFECSDGSEPACEDGSEPSRRSASGAPMCVQSTETQEGETCADGSAGECADVEWGCQGEPGASGNACPSGEETSGEGEEDSQLAPALSGAAASSW